MQERIYIQIRSDILVIYQLSKIQNRIISGIYKIDFPNGKIYIGQSQNIYKRILEHNQRGRKGTHDTKKIQLCEQAIHKYGEITQVDILEEVKSELLDQREAYWIKYFDAQNKLKGYNLLDKGNVTGRRGAQHVNSALNQEQVNQIIDLLRNHREMSYLDIAKQFNVYYDLIYRISAGKSYIQDNIVYPIRTNDHSASKKSKVLDYFKNEQELINLKEDLKYSWWLQMDNGDLYNKYNISRKLLYAINQGKIFAEIGKYTYPIRTKKNQALFSKEEVLEILSDLRNTKISMAKIGDKFNVNRCTISKVNQGEIYRIKDYHYPAR